MKCKICNQKVSLWHFLILYGRCAGCDLFIEAISNPSFCSIEQLLDLIKFYEKYHKKNKNACEKYFIRINKEKKIKELWWNE